MVTVVFLLLWRTGSFPFAVVILAIGIVIYRIYKRNSHRLARWRERDQERVERWQQKLHIQKGPLPPSRRGQRRPNTSRSYRSHSIPRSQKSSWDQFNEDITRGSNVFAEGMGVYVLLAVVGFALIIAAPVLIPVVFLAIIVLPVLWVANRYK
jgi:Flp pilus assembly protein TadB